MKVILYTTGCPKCRVLKNRLEAHGIKFTIETDEDAMIEKGFVSAPMLEVDDKAMNYIDAMNWVSAMG